MIPEWAYLTSEKKIIEHKPEKDIKLINFNTEKWLKLFGQRNKELKITNIGLYSIAKPEMRQLLKDYIRELAGDTSQLVVTETHGGLGGFTIALADIFKKVQSVEILKIHAEIIKNNTKVLGKNNVEVLNKNYAEVCGDLQQDVIISDPPWGGPSYYSKNYTLLGINNVNITYYINSLSKNYKFFILLVPSNFDFNDLIKNIKPELLKKMNIRHVNPKRPHHIFISFIGEKE